MENVPALIRMKLRFWMVFCGIILVIVSGCVPQYLAITSSPLNSAGTAKPIPISTPVPIPVAYAVLRTNGGNLRAGPGTNFPVVTVIKRGDTYPLIGRNEDGSWWQLCCVSDPKDASGEESLTVWIADTIVKIEGNVGQITGEVEQHHLMEPLFANDFTARWNVAYRCDSERCEVAECTGEVNAQVRSLRNNIWLEIDRNVSWLNNCGDDTLAQFQIQRYNGQDRQLGDDAAFFDRYWMGANPGEATKTISLADGQVLRAWCTDPQSIEREEDDQWTVLYDGEACYDLRSGMLLTLSYAKRWLLTGKIEGDTYERAYFGDSEYYDFELEFTNARLSVVN